MIEIFSRKKDTKSLSSLFIECSELTKKAFESMKDAVIAYVNGDYALAEQEADKTISLEKKQDRVKENLFERMFTRENMVFSRSDRIHIIEDLDDITDQIEIVVRKLLLYQVEIKQPLRAGIREIAELNSKIGENVHKMVISVLEDFEEAKQYVDQITDLRRTVREKRWELQKMNYKFQDNFMNFRYVESLIKQLMESADKSEIFADKILVLIYKYAL